MNTGAVVLGTHAFWFRAGDTVASVTAAASRARTSNVAVITTAAAHGLFTGAVVSMASFGGTGYNLSNKTITVLTATTFSYACTGSDEATTADTAGTVTLAGVASSTLRPGPNDSGYIDIGKIEAFSYSRTPGSNIEIYGPSPGQLVLVKQIENKQKLMAKFTAVEMSPLVMEILKKTLSLNSSSTQYNPLEGPQKEGWLKVQTYDQDNNIFNVSDLYGKLQITGDVDFGGSDAAKPQFEFTMFQSNLNTGTL